MAPEPGGASKGWKLHCAATYAQAGVLGGLDSTGLAARGEASGTHGYL